MDRRRAPPEVHRGEREREAGDVPHELAEKGAAYAGVDMGKRRPRDPASESTQQGPGAEVEDDADEADDGKGAEGAS